MSKMDGLRAMREARYERSLTQATLRGDARPDAMPTVEKKPSTDRRIQPAAAASADSPAEARCGHRAISGRTCTRERGHDAKSHRYS